MRNCGYILAVSILVVLGLSCSGCTRMMFFPSRTMVLSPDDIGLRYEPVSFESCRAVNITGWYLPAEGELRGSILFLHGNAENISTHINSVAWLPSAGYNVLLIDYRGYGRSDGAPGLEGSMCDAKRAWRFLTSRSETKGFPYFLFGQSLGGAIGANIADDPEIRRDLKGFISDSAFASFRSIAREKLDMFFLTRIVSGPLGVFFPSSDHDPAVLLPKLDPVPLLIIHGTEDPIVPYHHGEELGSLEYPHLSFLTARGAGHIAALRAEKCRRVFLDFLARRPLPKRLECTW